FQAEDGIRDKLVTGVQTCALPISHRCGQRGAAGSRGRRAMRDLLRPHGLQYRTAASVACRESAEVVIEVPLDLTLGLGQEPEARSGERRVGKEWRARWWLVRLKK